MSDDYGRGLVTDTELKLLTGDHQKNDAYRRVVVSRIRGRIQRLEEVELPVLDDHDSLGDELRDAIEPAEQTNTEVND